MTLTRTIGVIAGLVVLLLLVVDLRTRAVRIHYGVSQLDREVEGLIQQFRENELEIARLRNPARILKSAAAIRMARSAPRVQSHAAPAHSGGR